MRTLSVQKCLLNLLNYKIINNNYNFRLKWLTYNKIVQFY